MRLDRRYFLGSGTAIVAAGAATACMAGAHDDSGRAAILQVAQARTAADPPTDPICAVLMPFSRRPLGPGQVIEFDQVYEQVIAPAVRDSGLIPMRAEQRLGTIASQQTFERLLFADYLIADVSDEDTDVAYQLGVRQALRPRGTVLISVDFARRPFFAAASPVITYRVDGRGTPANAYEPVNRLKARLLDARDNPSDDSPLVGLMSALPRYQPDPAKIAAFHAAAGELSRTDARLDQASKTGEAAVLALAADPALLAAADRDSDLMVALFLALRGVAAFKQMIDLYGRMSAPLRRAPLVREQLAFALHRTGRFDEATRTIEGVISDEPTSRTYALLGRIYKDRWDEAAAAKSPQTPELLRRAIEAYGNGYQLDWRDAYPGINALTLMEMEDKIDPHQSELLPVVHYAALQHTRSRGDYWDYATLLELNVLSRDEAEAQAHLPEATARASQKWQLETTARNIKLIADQRRARSERVDWIDEIVAALTSAEPGKRTTP
jgi:MAP3K TRAFs-binding domain